MSFKVFPTPLNGHIHIIGSKSYGHRALIAASLSKGTSRITGLPNSDDIQVTLRALKHFGMTFEDHSLTGKPWIYDQKPIDCMASGSSLRFLIPLAMRLKENVYFTGEKRLFERPLDVYESLFESLTFDKTNEGLTVKGPLPFGHYPVEGHKSSQFLTGLLFALPNVRRDSVIELTTPLKSRSYVNITLEMLKRAGVHILEKDSYFMVHGKQTFHPFTYHVEGDYSQAAFFFVAGILGQKVRISNLPLETYQGDKQIIDILKRMGGDIKYEDDYFIVNESKTFGTEIDLEDIPDLGPILMILASLSKGKSVFTSVERLRYKESDRLEVMMHILKKFGVDLNYSNDKLVITGQHTLKGNQSFDTYGDHRIAMALAIASIKCDGPIIIHNPDVVSKSYPNFFDVFKQLGGQFHEFKSVER